MPYMGITPTVDATVLEVAEAWVQTNRDRFVWTKLPIFTVLGVLSGYSNTTTWKVPPLKEYLGRKGMRAHTRGQVRPMADPFGELSVSGTIYGSSSDGRELPLETPLQGVAMTAQQRYGAIKQTTEGLLSTAWIGREIGLASALRDGRFGSALDFDGTEPLKDPDTTGDRNALGNIQDQAIIYRRLTDGASRRLVCYTDETMLMILGRQTDFVGGGTGSGIANAIDESAVINILRTRCGFDEVRVFRAVKSDALPGATTDDVTRISSTPFLAGVVEVAGSGSVGSILPGSGRVDNADGGLIMLEEHMPYVELEVIDQKIGLKAAYATDNFGIVSPRTVANGGIQHGFIFTGNIISSP